MSDTVASLGFEVDSKSVKTATQDLKGLGEQAVKTSESVGKLQPSMQSIESAAKRAGVSVDEFKSRTAAFNAESDRLAASTGKAGSALGAIARDAATVSPALSAVAVASKAAAVEHEAHSLALGNLRSNLRSLSPLLNQLGGGMGDLLQYSRAARLGLEGLAIVAGGALLIALAKVGDEVERTKNRFAALTGSTEQGNRTISAVRDAAKGSGVEFDTLASFVEKVAQGFDKAASRSVIYADTGDRVTKVTEQAAAAGKTLGQVLQSNLANAEEESRVFGALADSIQKTGTVSAETFQTIRDQSPGTARAISEAFGFRDINEFQRELEKIAGIPLDQFIQTINKIGPAVQQNFDANPVKTVDQAIREVKTAWDEFVKSLADTGAIGVVKDILKELPGIVKQDAADLKGLATAFTAIDDAAGKANAAVLSFAGGALDKLGSLASSAVNAARAVAGAISSMFSGGGAAAAGGAGGTEGMQLGPSSDSGGSSSGSSSSFAERFSPVSDVGGNDTSAMDYGGGSADYGYFASGGQFTVAGSGGTDSQTVSFKATPGEVVTVSAPGATTIQGLPESSVTPSPAALATVKEITDAIDQSTIDITKKSLEGTNLIVEALNKLIGGTKSPTLNPATGLPVSAPALGAFGLANATYAGTGLVGGGGPSGGGSKHSQSKPQPQEQALSPQEFYGNPNYGYPGGAMGRGASVRGAYPRAPRQFPSRPPIQPGSPTGWGDYQPYSFGDPIDSPVSDYYGTAGDFYGSLNDIGYDTSSFYGTNYDGSGDFTGSISDIGMTDILTGGNDTGAMDYGGGSYDAGYFATGGSFKVPGSGGGDRTVVKMHVTPGEQVIVVPNSGTPSGINMPQFSNPSPDPSSQLSTTQTTTKNVTINVQAGIQADSFIRSRAQIARGI